MVNNKFLKMTMTHDMKNRSFLEVSLKKNWTESKNFFLNSLNKSPIKSTYNYPYSYNTAIVSRYIVNSSILDSIILVHS